MDRVKQASGIKITGHCYCGEVRFAYDAGTELFMDHCHCESCRRATSSAFTSFIGVPDGRWAWTGVLPKVHQTPAGVTRAFCSNCGSPMAFQTPMAPGETHFYAASLDDPAVFVPTHNDHRDEMVPWVTGFDTLPDHGDQWRMRGVPHP